jgi:hypothetical protein
LVYVLGLNPKTLTSLHIFVIKSYLIVLGVSESMKVLGLTPCQPSFTKSPQQTQENRHNLFSSFGNYDIPHKTQSRIFCLLRKRLYYVMVKCQPITVLG